MEWSGLPVCQCLLQSKSHRCSQSSCFYMKFLLTDQRLPPDTHTTHTHTTHTHTNERRHICIRPTTPFPPTDNQSLTWNTTRTDYTVSKSRVFFLFLFFIISHTVVGQSLTYCRFKTEYKKRLQCGENKSQL